MLIDNVKNLDRAYEYAEKFNMAEVWSLLGGAQLRDGLMKEAVDSYIKAQDPTNYLGVIQAAQTNGRDFMLTVDGRISDFYMGRDGFLIIFFWKF